MVFRWVVIILTSLTFAACSVTEVEAEPIYFDSYEDFESALDQAVSAGEVDALWDGIKAVGMPLIFGERVVLMHQADADQVQWGGEWTDWMGESGIRIEGSNVWIYTTELPMNARVMYQIVEDEGEPMPDSFNANSLETSSVIEMPNYDRPTFLDYRDGIVHGLLERDQILHSEHLGYDVTYRVYRPADEFIIQELPTLYITDGPSYVSYGQMVNALDNLIAAGKIQPILVVFLDPRSTVGRLNQRNEELIDNPDYGLFIADELVPHIDSYYMTNPSPDARALVGASFGGYHTAYFALRHSDTFHLFGMQSPVIPLDLDDKVVRDHKMSERLPIKKIFLSIGIYEWMGDAEALHKAFEMQGYDVLYMEAAEGHHYGNWSGQFDDLLIYFFGPDETF